MAVIPGMNAASQSLAAVGMIFRLHVRMASSASMQRFEAFFIRLADARHHGINPMKLALQVLIDQHQRLKRAAHIAIACRDDFLDCNFCTPGRHL